MSAYTYTPLQALGTVEHFSSPMRAKGLVITNVLSQTMGFINLFAGPIALQNIGYKYIIFFACWDLVEAACWWLFGVEAQGRSLEEMDWVVSSRARRIRYVCLSIAVRAAQPSCGVQEAQLGPGNQDEGSSTRARKPRLRTVLVNSRSAVRRGLGRRLEWC